MRISRGTVLIGILVVLIAFAAAWHLAHRAPAYEPVETVPTAPSFVPKPRSADEILAAILKSGSAGPGDVEELLRGDKSLARPDAAPLEQEFRRTLKSPPIITANYDVPTEDYVPKGTHAWLQPLVARKVTESDDEVRWFEWLDDDTLVYSTLKGIYRKDLHGPPELLARAPMARASVPCLSPDRKSVAAVVWGGIMVVDTETAEQTLHEFDKPISDVTWSPDSRLVGFTTRTELWTLDPGTDKMHRLYHAEYLKSGEEVETKPSKVSATDYVQWSPDGRYVSVRQILRGEFAYLTLVTLSSVSGGGVRRIDCWNDSYLSWSPDSQTVAYANSGGEPDGYVFALDLRTGKERLSYCNGTDTIHGRSAWSCDGRYLAIEFLGRGYFDVVATYRPLDLFEPTSGPASPHPVASRALPFAWHPSRQVIASAEETKPAVRDYRRPMEDIPTFGWTIRLTALSGKRNPMKPYTGYRPEIAETVPMPPVVGRKQTPRWSPDGTKLAVLCDLSGSYQVYVTGLLSQEKTARNAETWLGSAREYLRTGEIAQAVACLQNAVRLGASPDARILLTRTYLDLAEMERNQYQRWKIYQGAIHEASNVPFKSLDADLKHHLMQCIIDSDVLSGAFGRVADSKG